LSVLYQMREVNDGVACHNVTQDT